MHSHGRLTLGGWCAACLLSCSPQAEISAQGEICPVSSISAAIVGGVPEPATFSFDEDRILAVVGVEIVSERAMALCSGVLIAAGHVLTARHCLDVARIPFSEDAGFRDRGEINGLAVVFGDSVQRDSPRVAAVGAELHPTLDVALLELGPLPVGLTEPEPISLPDEPVDESWVGSLVEIGGFGATDVSAGGSRLFVTEPVVAVEDHHLVVDGGGVTGACVGDSGGPLLARDSRGVVRTFGILDGGSSDCRGLDEYTRGDRIAEWTTLSRSVPAEPVRQARCEGLSPTGECVREMAMWCAETSPRSEHCATNDRICGWSNTENGFRCVRQEQDTCEGLGSRRRCDEEKDEVVSCERGTIRRSSCVACGTVCIDFQGSLGAGCRYARRCSGGDGAPCAGIPTSTRGAASPLATMLPSQAREPPPHLR